MVDDFVLSALVTNTINGLLHFTEDTNLASLPIKFAPTPYIASNFPPVLIFSNDFGSALAGLYNIGSHHSGRHQQPGHRHPELDGRPGIGHGRQQRLLRRGRHQLAGDGHRRACSASCPPPPATVTSSATTSAARAPSAGGTAALTR